MFGDRKISIITLTVAIAMSTVACGAAEEGTSGSAAAESALLIDEGGSCISNMLCETGLSCRPAEREDLEGPDRRTCERPGSGYCDDDEDCGAGLRCMGESSSFSYGSELAGPQKYSLYGVCTDAKGSSPGDQLCVEAGKRLGECHVPHADAVVTACKEAAAYKEAAEILALPCEKLNGYSIEPGFGAKRGAFCRFNFECTHELRCRRALDKTDDRDAVEWTSRSSKACQPPGGATDFCDDDSDCMSNLFCGMGRCQSIPGVTKSCDRPSDCPDNLACRPVEIKGDPYCRSCNGWSWACQAKGNPS